MPSCLRGYDFSRIVNTQIEWREPPGMLGEYVRRVKRQTLAMQASKRAQSAGEVISLFRQAAKQTRV